MDYKSPEFGASVLKRLFTDKQVEIRDYSKITHCLDNYKSWGITVLAYDGTNGLSIRYIPSNEIGEPHVTKKIEFVLNDEYDSCLISSCWDVDDVDDSVYDYFVFIIDKMRKDRSELRQHMSKFSSKSWIKRHKQLREIVE